MPLHIVTERLVLKPHTPTNLQWLNTLFNSADEQHFNGDDPPKERPETLEETAKILERILTRPPGSDIIDYAIHRRDDDALIGCGMIAHVDNYNRRCDLGISMGYDQGNWGRGYGREALQAIIAHCFGALRLHRIGAEIYEFNDRSLRLFERLGFRREGSTRQHILKAGVFRDVFLYGLLEEEWKK